MKNILFILLVLTILSSCTKKYYLTSSGGERPLPKYNDIFKIDCAAGTTLVDINYYYREYSIDWPVTEHAYHYVRFLDNCRLMENTHWSKDSTQYSKLENIDAELIGKYTIDNNTRKIVIKKFSQNKWGIVITGYGTVSRNSDTIHIYKEDIPRVYNPYTNYLIRTNIPVKNKLVGEW